MPNSSPVEQRAFPPEWIVAQKRRHGNRPKFERPKMFSLWTADRFEEARGLIEQWVELVPSNKRLDIITRLRIDRSFGDTIATLAVGDALRSLGHAVEYEADVGLLTPDWLAKLTCGASFMLEVVADKPPADRQAFDDSLRSLGDRLGAMPGNEHLSIQPNAFDDRKCRLVPISGKNQKRIANAVKDWLGSKPRIGEMITVCGLVIHLVQRIPDLANVSWGTGLSGYEVSHVPLTESVKDKAKKYNPIAEEKRLPLVVCVIPEFSTGRGYFDLETAVLGTQKCRIVTDELGRQCSENYRADDGLFGRFPTLSAVALGQWNGYRITLDVIHNDNATYPIPRETFQIRN